MSYISASTIESDVLVWERNEAGERETVYYEAPFYCYQKSKFGEYTSLYGDTLSRIDFSDAGQMRSFRLKHPDDLFESDIPPELKILSSEYHDATPPNLHITVFDIEVDYDPESEIDLFKVPYAPINSIALYHFWLDETVLLCVPPKGQEHWTPKQLLKEFNDRDDLPEVQGTLKIEIFKNEKKLLESFLEYIKDTDLLSGYNSESFDIPYLCDRLKKISKTFLSKMSFADAPPPKSSTKLDDFGNEITVYTLSGRAHLDYMLAFKKYEMAGRPSYSLEAIADEVVPDLPKLKYEGTLAELYNNDFALFVRYNIRDTEVLKGMEEKLGYLSLSNDMIHMSTGLFQHVLGTIKLAELSVINYCHYDLGGVIVPDVHPDVTNTKIKGAFVLIPQIGLHKNIGSIDIASLYPSAIMSLNISPEMVIGQFENNVADHEEIMKRSDEPITLVLENGKKASAPASKWVDIFHSKNYAVSGYGTVFDQNSQGVVPMILTDWFAQRKKYKVKQFEAITEYERLVKNNGSAEDIKKALDESSYNDRLQYIFKIKLNSFYGALVNAYFRFGDPRLGESTTGVGRLILLHQCAKVCDLLDGEYAQPDIRRIEHKKKKKGSNAIIGDMNFDAGTTAVNNDKGTEHFGYSDDYSVVYGDTDSTYFVTHTTNVDDATKLSNHVASKVNDSFQEFMQDAFLCTPKFDKLISCEREVISDNGIFVNKKRYVLHLVDLDGHKVDKLKVMGLETKKTTLNAEISKELDRFVARILTGEAIEDITEDIVALKKKIATTTDMMFLGLPKGVNGVEKYTDALAEDKNARLPGHVAASIFYNQMLVKFKDTVSPKIRTGMKIKVFYLTTPKGRFKAIALPGDIPKVPDWFFRKEFTVAVDMHIERMVDKPLGSVFDAIGLTVPTFQDVKLKDIGLEF